MWCVYAARRKRGRDHKDTRRAITAKIKEAQAEGCVSVGVPAASSGGAI